MGNQEALFRPDDLGDEVVKSVGSKIAHDFVAGAGGNALMRIDLENPTTMATRSVLATGDAAIVLSEGDSHDDLPANVRIGDLSGGELAINRQGNFVGSIDLSDTRRAIALFLEDQSSLVVNQGTSTSKLFQGIDSTVFCLIGAGDPLPDGPGTAYEISTIRPMPFEGDRSGAHAHTLGEQDELLLTEVVTTSGHTLLVRFESLLVLKPTIPAIGLPATGVSYSSISKSDVTDMLL